MAAQTEELILEISVQQTSVTLASLKQNIDDLIKQRQVLTDASKTGDAEAAKSLEVVNSTIRNTQQEYRTQTKVLDGYLASKKSEVNTSNLAANSIQTNRDLLKQLTAEYINLKTPSENAIGQIRALSDVLKKQEADIGDTRRNVGNYGNAFIDAFSKINIGGKSLGGVIDPIKNIVSGFSAASAGAEGFSAALLATGIPILIAGIEGAVSIMQKFQSVTNGVSDTFGGLNTAFDYFIGNGGRSDQTLSEFSKGMGEAYDEGVKLTKQTRELALAQSQQNVTNAQANAQIATNLIALKDKNKTTAELLAISKSTGEIEKANHEQNLKIARDNENIAAIEYANAIRNGIASDEAAKKLNAASAERVRLDGESAEVEEKISVRTNKIIEDDILRRAASLQKAADLSIANGTATANALIGIELEKRSVLLEQTKLSAQEREDIAAESNQKIIKIQQDFANKALADKIKSDELVANAAKMSGEDITAQLIKIEQEREKLLLNNQLLTNKERTNIIKEAEENISQIRIDASKKRLADLIKAEELLAEETKRTGQDNTEILIDIELHKRALLLSSLKAESKEYENVVRASELVVQQIKIDSANKQAAVDIKAEEIRVAGIKQEIDTQTKSGKLFGADLITQRQHLADLQIEIERKKAATLLNNTNLSEKEQQNIVSDSLNKQKDIRDKAAQDTIDTALKVQQAEIEAAGTISDGVIGFMQNIAEASGASADYQKSLAFIEIGVKTAVALAGAISQAQSVPFPANIAAIATGVAAVLGGIGSAIALLTKTDKVPSSPKIGALGGDMSLDVGGMPHSQGGTQYYGEDGNRFELERDEKIFVLKRNASEKINLLSQWNQFWGGKSWTGQPVRHAALGGAVSDGGFAIRDVSRNTDNNRQLITQMKEAISGIPAPILQIKELNKKNQALSKSVDIREM